MQDRNNQSAKVSIAQNVIAVVAGLFTGGLIGAALSSIALNLLAKAGCRGSSRWAAWAALGVVGVPISWAFTFAIAPDTFKNATTPAPPTTISPAAPTPTPSASAIAAPVPQETSAPQEKPALTDAQIWQLANTESCWDVVRSQWGFDSPKGEVVGAYAGMGYEQSKLDTMYDLTKVAAVKLLENDRNIEATKAAMASEWLDGSDTAAAIVVGIANDVYLPKHLKIAAEKCTE